MQTNTQRLTKDYCLGKRLVFFPKTEKEAEFVLRSLYGMGFAWPNGQTNLASLEDCARSGVLLTSDGVIYHSPSTWDEGLLCTAEQFDKNYLSPDMTLLMAQFNKLAARIEEIAKGVAEIKKQLEPEKLDKPSLKNKGPEQP